MFADGATIIMFLINHHFVGARSEETDALKSPTSLASQSLLGSARYRPMTYVLIMHVGAT